MKKILLVIIMLLMTTPVLANTCEYATKQEWLDKDVESVFETDCNICQVEIKAATNTITFTEDGCIDAYCVGGINTGVGRVYENDPEHEISHVVWYHDCSPTSVDIITDNSVTIGWFLIGVSIGAMFAAGILLVSFNYHE